MFLSLSSNTRIQNNLITVSKTVRGENQGTQKEQHIVKIQNLCLQEVMMAIIMEGISVGLD